MQKVSLLGVAEERRGRIRRGSCKVGTDPILRRLGLCGEKAREKRLARQRNFFGTLHCKRHFLNSSQVRGRQEAMFKCDMMMMNDIDDCVVKLFTATSPTAKTILA